MSATRLNHGMSDNAPPDRKDATTFTRSTTTTRNPIITQVKSMMYFHIADFFTRISVIPIGLKKSPNCRNIMTTEWIEHKVTSTKEKGPNRYWQAMYPKRASLRLTGSIDYVTKHYDNDPTFVYWPDYMVAGKAGDIKQLFADAGMDTICVGALHAMTNGEFGDPANDVPLSENAILSNSFVPSDTNMHSCIESMTKLNEECGDINRLVSDIAIGKALEDHLRKTPSSGKRMTKGMTAKKKALVDGVNAKMSDAIEGTPLDCVYDVTTYNGDKFTGVKTKNMPLTKCRALQPTIMIGEETIMVPIVAQSTGKACFEQFVNDIVCCGEYADHAKEMIRTLAPKPTPKTRPAPKSKSKKATTKTTKDKAPAEKTTTAASPRPQSKKSFMQTKKERSGGISLSKFNGNVPLAS